MKLLHPMTCNFMVYKDYKNQLKICISSMWNQLQDPTPHLSSYRSSCHHSSQYFLEVPPMRVSSSYHPLTLDHTFLTNDLLLSKFIQVCHTGGGMRAKSNLLVLCDDVLDGFFKLFLCFHTISMWYIQLFCKF